ncbi:single-stranded DNA-binding protein [Variovorax rhizosphaerae]|uniref:Single-stranded DNA-binding protein n=1 Tax=Variovorax rhizosphaerae TaxID=1836200 RepID=A0ABU8WLE8_9BURK
MSQFVALIVGRLAADPERKVGQSGRPYTRARVALSGGEGTGVQHVLVTAFSTSVQATLLALRAGMTVAVSGPMKAGVWVPPDGGAPRVNLSIVADNIMTLAEHERAGQAVRAARAAPAATPASTAPNLRRSNAGPPCSDAVRSREQARALWQPGAGVDSDGQA